MYKMYNCTKPVTRGDFFNWFEKNADKEFITRGFWMGFRNVQNVQICTNLLQRVISLTIDIENSNEQFVTPLTRWFINDFEMYKFVQTCF